MHCRAAPQSGSTVPISTVSACASAANSADSSRAYTMAGEAPMASKTFAIMLMATKLVIL